MTCGIWNSAWVAVLALAVVGCGQQGGPAPTADAERSPFVASSEPAGAVPVGDARQSVEDQDDVVMVGRIGGSANPFVDGIAAFTIVDPKIPYCAEEEGCPTPWDYCCTQDQVKENVAVVKVVDDAGNPVANDARELLGVKELNLVVVRGKAERDMDGNLAVLAEEVFVRE